MPKIDFIGGQNRLVPKEGTSSYLAKLAHHIQTSTNHNVNIHCKNQKIIKANKLLLSCSSDFLKRIFECDLATAYLGLNYDVMCPDFDGLAMTKVLELISSGNTLINSTEENGIVIEMLDIINSLKIYTNMELIQGKILSFIHIIASSSC